MKVSFDEILHEHGPIVSRIVSSYAHPGPDREDLLQDVMAGEVSAVVALGPTCAETAEQLAPLAKLETFITLSANEGVLTDVASIVVPVASWAESFGTFVNAKGMAQTFQRAIPAPAGVEPAWKTIAKIAEAIDSPLGFERVADVRTALGKSAPAPTSAPTSAAPAPAE